eukprot:scaffold69224_cov36-Prasinocladus_malaysianus.AAC.1
MTSGYPHSICAMTQIAYTKIERKGGHNVLVRSIGYVFRDDETRSKYGRQSDRELILISKCTEVAKRQHLPSSRLLCPFALPQVAISIREPPGARLTGNRD